MRIAEVVAYLQALGTVRSRFRFALGTLVHWSGGEREGQPYRILQRRLTEGAVSTWTQYLLSSERFPGREASWGYEPDVEPWEGGSP